MSRTIGELAGMPRVPTVEEAHAAADAWRFNCGPAALCAISGLTPEEVRAHLPGFPGYTNPTLMATALRSMGRTFRSAYRGDDPVDLAGLPTRKLALTRIQFGGQWTRPGVPMSARYRHTHWVAEARGHVFDVNALGYGGWLPYRWWAYDLIPWLIEEAVPGADGSWWPSHVWEISS